MLYRWRIRRNISQSITVPNLPCRKLVSKVVDIMPKIVYSESSKRNERQY